jgi:hypothetical protein
MPLARVGRLMVGRPLPFYLVQRLGTNSTKPHHLACQQDGAGNAEMAGNCNIRKRVGNGARVIGTPIGGQKMHIFTPNIPTFHSRYRR